jgi:hypothetical protein
MRGLLADVNAQGHLPYLRRLLEKLDLWSVLAELHLDLVTFRDLNLPHDLDDRTLWNRCQQDEWVLFTDNRNHENENSLQATLADSWREGHLPVVTLANKGKFDHSVDYAKRVAIDVAELLFGIYQGQYRDQRRIYVPFSASEQVS